VCAPYPVTPVRLRTFHAQGALARNPQAFVTTPNNCYKLIGGGARSNWQVYGSLLTANAPDGGAVPSQWFGYAKDASYPDPTTVTVSGIGLYDAQNVWNVQASQAMSVASSAPSVSATVPSGYAMTSGGCFVDSPAVFLTASFPSSNTTWECHARAHITPGSARLTAYVVGIRPVDMMKPPPTVQITSGTSGVGSNVQAIAVGAPGYVVTGGGALTLLDDTATPPQLLADQLLTGSYPGVWPASWVVSTASSNYVTLIPIYWIAPNAWYASSKDHVYSSKGRVRAFAVNVKFD